MKFISPISVLITIGLTLIAGLTGIVYRNLDRKIDNSQTKDACNERTQALTKQFCLKLETIETKFEFISEDIKEMKRTIGRIEEKI